MTTWAGSEVSARSKARKRAIDLLYGADLREISVEELLVQEGARAVGEPARAASWAYAKQIVTGVQEHREAIDQAITAHAKGWTLERMPVLDRAIARVGAWEVLFNPEVPDQVAIAEAAEAAAVLSTDDSAGFLSGVLGAISREATA